MANMMIAACGLDCAECNAYKAWKTDDQALRVKTAAEWTKSFNFAFAPEMINCSGCRVAEGPKIGHCAECGFRACAQKKGLGTCAECGEYACADLKGFLAGVPQAKANLEKLRA
jgi:hypothetical protein